MTSARPRVHYVSNARLPSEKANTLQTMKMCEGFARAGAEVTLFHPWRKQTGVLASADLWTHYGVARDAFAIRRLPALDLLPAAERTGLAAAAKGAYLLQTWTYTAIAVPVLAAMPRGLIFTREIFAVAALAPLARVRGLSLLYECHTLPNPRLFPALRMADGVVCVSGTLAEQVKEAGARRVLTAPNGVDLARYEGLPARAEARRALGWDDRPVAAYTGQLFAWKGVGTLIDAAARIPGVRVVLVGGTGKELADARARAAAIPNLEVVGQIPPGEVPLRTCAADVLVLPNTAKDTQSREHTSPLKLFEYFASGTPVVASDLPSVREIANPGNALLVPPDDPAALAAGIERVLADPAGARERAGRAREEVAARTWTRRAQAILAFAEGNG